MQGNTAEVKRFINICFQNNSEELQFISLTEGVQSQNFAKQVSLRQLPRVESIVPTLGMCLRKES